MDCSFGVSLSIKPATSTHVRNVMWALGLAVASTVIVFASLGSLQNQCRNEDPTFLTGINGFSGAVLGCKKLYRYWWFVTALDFVVGAYGLWVVATGALSANRGAVVGLLVVAQLLTINMTDAFYSILDIPKFQSNTGRDRAHTMVAGCICTAVFQAIAIFLAGMDAPAAVSTSEEPPKAKTVELPAVPAKAAEPAPPAPTPAPAPVPAEIPDASEPAAAEPATAPTESAVAVTVQ